MKFLCDVITYCAILYNILLGQSHGDHVERLLQVMGTKGLEDNTRDEYGGAMECAKGIYDDCGLPEGT